MGIGQETRPNTAIQHQPRAIQDRRISPGHPEYRLPRLHCCRTRRLGRSDTPKTPDAPPNKRKRPQILLLTRYLLRYNQAVWLGGSTAFLMFSSALLFLRPRTAAHFKAKWKQAHVDAVLVNAAAAGRNVVPFVRLHQFVQVLAPPSASRIDSCSEDGRDL